MAASTDLLPPVLYEDAELLVLQEPAGLLVAPDRWDKTRVNLMEQLHRLLSPGILNVHRLDLQTSGVLVCAKTEAALRAVSAAFERGEVSKQYLALTTSAPNPPSQTVSAPLAPDRVHPGRMVAALGGAHAKPATTRVELIERWRTGHALVRALPLTGRTHQVRVHLACASAPIIADAFYGSARGLYLSDLKRRYKPGSQPERPLIDRVALHAASVTFPHPKSGEVLQIEAPLPADFALAVEMLSRWAA